jgi:hypothetical protein
MVLSLMGLFISNVCSHINVNKFSGNSHLFAHYIERFYKEFHSSVCIKCKQFIVSKAL